MSTKDKLQITKLEKNYILDYKQSYGTSKHRQISNQRSDQEGALGQQGKRWKMEAAIAFVMWHYYTR